MSSEAKVKSVESAEEVKNMLRQKLDSVKAYLPKGCASEVAQDLKCGVATVYHTLNGKGTNKAIMLALVEIGNREKLRVDNALNQ